MALQFKTATKAQSRLRLALFGPSGSGKTYSALRIASGLGGRIAVIDTERGSASLYADRFDFDVLDLPNSNIDTYCEAMVAAAKEGYDVLIIDSLTHGWHYLLEEVDRLAKTRYRGNTWSAWSEGTPRQKRLIDAMLRYPGHLIATMRSKTEWATDKDERGKSTPTRVGLAPEQGKGIEYEFTLLMEMNAQHVGNVIKDRTGRFQDRLIDKPDEAFGQELAAWLQEGEPAPEAEPYDVAVYSQSSSESGSAEQEMHWAQRADVLARFWPWTERMGLSRDQVHRALGVEHLHEYQGTMHQARLEIEEWVDEESASDAPQSAA